MRDPRVAQARLGSLVLFFVGRWMGSGRGERSDTCQTVFHFVPCDAARAGSVAPLGPSPRRSERRASTRARGATGAEAEDAAAGANVRVGGAWVTPGPRRFSDRVAPQTPARCPRPSSSPRRARPRTSWSRPDPTRGQARKRLNARNLDSRFPMDGRARLPEKQVARTDATAISRARFPAGHAVCEFQNNFVSVTNPRKHRKTCTQKPKSGSFVSNASARSVAALSPATARCDPPTRAAPSLVVPSSAPEPEARLGSPDPSARAELRAVPRHVAVLPLDSPQAPAGQR